MQRVDGRYVYAASDLNNYLECSYLTHLDELVVLGERAAPERDDPTAELLARKGDEHEQRYLSELQGRSRGVTVLERPEHSLAGFEEAQNRTIAAMDRGDAIVYQGTFFDGEFLGHPDFLRRVEEPSARWPWSYEVIDTKLALNPKPYFIVQICNYSEHLARIQGTMPKFASIVLGTGEERRYRLSDYLAYYRRVKARFAAFCYRGPSNDALYPHKCAHCNTCKWDAVCTVQRENDDHLSLVARMRRDQIDRLNKSGLNTLPELAAAHDGLRPQGMNPDTFARLRLQAAMQVRGRTEGPVHQLIAHEPWNGFGLLPEPAAGDVFFDMEGDPLYEPGRGLEYLFGCWLPVEQPNYKAFWALDRGAEKRAFEEFVDFIVDRKRAYPKMHVYHYADYEKSALGRLAQAHGTRETEIDDLLRAEIFVDLFAVVRQSLVISESSYSIKKLERFYPLERATDVKRGDVSIVMFEQWLIDRSRGDILEDIQRYNEDDCRSTLLLRNWLLERRDDAIAKWGDIPFHVPKLQCHPEIEPACKKCANRAKTERENAQTSDLQRRLLDGVSTPGSREDYESLDEDSRARYLLGHLLAYHRREEKPVWWAFFDRCENADRLLEFDKDALGGLRLERGIAPYRKKGDKNYVYTYSFPDQMYSLGSGDAPYDPATGKGAGTIVSIDDENNLLELKRSGSIEEAAKTTALIPGQPMNTNAQKAALVRLAHAYSNGTLGGASLDLLLARKPRLRSGESKIQPLHVTPESVSAVAQALDDSYLFIQGPPGSGKTTTGARILCDLLEAGKRVGITSTGHKAIHNLLHKVESCARKRGLTFKGYYKHTKSNPGSEYVSRIPDPFVASHDSNDLFEGQGYHLVAGTAWLFSRENLNDSFDYLFIDEAGQMALADALAVSGRAKNVVLLGDPLQLAQVSQGAHPPRAGDSVLEHLLGASQTVPEDRGIFLDVSYRMHPEICEFISRSMYDGRLRAASDTALQRIESPGLHGSGLRSIAVSHAGNGRESLEEARRIAEEIAFLLRGTVTDCKGRTRPLESEDIIVVTPYNAQRRLISKVLHEAGIDVRAGTVDKFQGQEAFVVFYSMATSSGEDIPRDLEFLFDKNRFNVAVSRARAISVVVCSAQLTDVRCSRVEQIPIVNALCEYLELAQDTPEVDSTSVA